MAPLIQALISTDDVHVDTPARIGSVPRWTTEQEENLKVYSQKQGDGVARQRELDQPQLKVYSRKRSPSQALCRGGQQSRRSI